MAEKTLYYCDGCKAKMSVDERAVSVDLAAEYAKQNPHGVNAKLFDHVVHFNVLTEIFCHVCQQSSWEYWSSKLDNIPDLILTASARYTKMRASFFEGKKAKLKAVV